MLRTLRSKEMLMQPPYWCHHGNYTPVCHSLTAQLLRGRRTDWKVNLKLKVCVKSFNSLNDERKTPLTVTRVLVSAPVHVGDMTSWRPLIEQSLGIFYIFVGFEEKIPELDLYSEVERSALWQLETKMMFCSSSRTGTFNWPAQGPDVQHILSLSLFMV